MSYKFKKPLYSVLILILILLINVIFWGLNRAYYNQLQTQLNISEKTGISESGLQNITEKLIGYLTLQEDNLYILEEVGGETRQIFNQREIDHMIDVKNLFLLSYGIIFLLIAIFITRVVLLNKRNEMYKMYEEVKLSFLITIGLSIIAFVIFRTNFDWFWEVFHEVFFFNDLYLLNPQTDILIQMMPLQFFLSISQRVLLSFGIMHFFILLITKIGAVRYDKKNRSRHS